MEIYRLNRSLVHLAGYKINTHNIYYLCIIFIIMYKNQNKLLIYFLFYKL